MDISRLNLRGRMAYGLHCLLSLMKRNDIEIDNYKEEIDILTQFTSAENLADWDANAKGYIYEKYPDEVLVELIPGLLDKLYWIGASELYTQPSDCRESENLLREIIVILTANSAPIPDINAYSSYTLKSPISTSDYFGEPFVFDCSQQAKKVNKLK